jgi:hypothetical protein
MSNLFCPPTYDHKEGEEVEAPPLFRGPQVHDESEGEPDPRWAKRAMVPRATGGNVSGRFLALVSRGTLLAWTRLRFRQLGWPAACLSSSCAVKAAAGMASSWVARAAAVLRGAPRWSATCTLCVPFSQR